MTKITYNENGIPNRVEIGIGRGTVSFPTATFVGHPDDYEWPYSTQRNHYEVLKAALIRNGFDVMILGAATYKDYNSRSSKAKLTVFTMVAGTKDGIKLVWCKSEGQTAGGGQNHIYVNGKDYNTTMFTPRADHIIDSYIEPDLFRRQIRRLAAGLSANPEPDTLFLTSSMTADVCLAAISKHLKKYEMTYYVTTHYDYDLPIWKTKKLDFSKSGIEYGPFDPLSAEAQAFYDEHNLYIKIKA